MVSFTTNYVSTLELILALPIINFLGFNSVLLRIIYSWDKSDLQLNIIFKLFAILQNFGAVTYMPLIRSGLRYFLKVSSSVSK